MLQILWMIIWCWLCCTYHVYISLFWLRCNLCMLVLGLAHLSHPTKHDLGWAVGGGWAMSQARCEVANMTSPQPGWWGAGTQTAAGGRPRTGLTGPGPVELARPAAARVANMPRESETERRLEEKTERWVARGRWQRRAPDTFRDLHSYFHWATMT
jgi:hypothetical protein